MRSSNTVAVLAAGLAALLAFTSAADDTTSHPESVQSLTLPAIDLPAVRAEDVEREEAGLPMRFAIVHSVLVRPPARSGWARQGTAELTWSLVVRSPGARSLNFGFRRFRMPPGGRLAIAAADGSHRLRPFTALDEDAHGELWTPVVLGEEAVLQVAVPADRLDAAGTGLLAIDGLDSWVSLFADGFESGDTSAWSTTVP